MATIVDDVIAGAPLVITFIAGADIVVGQVVGMDTDAPAANMTVTPLTNDGILNVPVGVATDSRASADDVPVALPPSIVRVRCNESETAIACGDFVGMAGTVAGEVTKYVPNESEGAINLGQALEAIALGAVGRVRLAVSISI